MSIRNNTDQIVMIIAISIAVINYVILYLLKYKFKNHQMIPRYINTIRIILGCTSAITLILQQPYYSFWFLMAGISTFLINNRIKRINRKRYSNTPHIELQQISDQLFFAPIFGAFLFVHDSSYIQFIAWCTNKFNLKLSQNVTTSYFHYNTIVVYCYIVLEFILSVYPQLKTGKRTGIVILTKTFLSIQSLIYAYANTCGFNLTIKPFYYSKMSQKFLLNIPDYLLINTIMINVVFFLFQQIPQYQYANTLSLINWACGIMSVNYVIKNLKKERISIKVGYYIILGQIADLFDGRAAEKFGSTKHGEILDDLADFTSFGIATGLYIYKILKYELEMNKYNSLLLSSIYICAILYRLIRFLISKRKQGIKTGVKYFEGYPSPAGAAAMNFLNSIQELMREKIQTKLQLAQIFYCSYLCLVIALTVSKIKYPHFGRVIVNSKKIPIQIKSIILAYFIQCMWKSIIDQKYLQMFVLFFLFGMSYTFLPLFQKSWLYQQGEQENISEMSEESPEITKKQD